MTNTRRDLLAAIAALGALPAGAAAPAAPAAGEPFSWAGLRALAAGLAAKPYAPPPPPDPAVAALDYDAVGEVRYRAADTVLRDGGRDGGVRFFPVSRMQPRPVTIALVAHGLARPFRYSPALFEMPAGSPFAALGIEAGFAGFRAMNPSGDSDWLAFLGASYFRASGALDQYGLSARGLAIDSGGPMAEEFPAFTRFWLERGGDGALIVYALLEGPGVAGAYRFVNRRGPAGVTQDVSATITLRRDVERLGLAPLTSMFWYGQSDRAQATDWRPEVHDSDGLLIHTGSGERIWRPLTNPPRAIVNSFADQGPKGFGLMQRDRAFDHYQDDGVFYEKRPSAWVTPTGGWGAGAVTLVELPTADETADNIVAFWTPAAPAKRGRTYAIGYTIDWIAGEPAGGPLARVVGTWRGGGGLPGQPPLADRTKLVVDFAGSSLVGLGRDAGVVPGLDVQRARPSGVAAYPVAGRPGLWRFMVDLKPEGAGPVDVRVALTRDGRPLTETCVVQLHPR